VLYWRLYFTGVATVAKAAGVRRVAVLRRLDGEACYESEEIMMANASTPVCPLCKAEASMMTDLQPSYQGKNYCRVFACEYCDLQFIDPMIAPPGLYDSIYQNVDRLPGYHRYARYRDRVRAQDKPLAWLASQEPAYWFIKRELENLPRAARILEIGSGLGYLTYAVQQAGYDITGLDISLDAITSARAKFGDLYLHKDLHVLAAEQPRSFDAVIMTEVIEHVADPSAFLDATASLLKPGGSLLITTPNKSYSPLGARWQTESPPVHLWWFSETAMRRLAEISRLGIRFGDFSSVYRSRKKPAAASPTPAWLDDRGQVTDAAVKWIDAHRKSEAKMARLRSYLWRIRPLVQNVIRARRGYPALAQRSWQMGVVLTKKAVQQASADERGGFARRSSVSSLV
jgi:SAM-dependent methyltransferase